MTVERMIELLEIEKECVLRNASGECNRYCAGCDLLQDDTELHEMYTGAIALLKAQEAATVEPKRIELADETKTWLDKMEAVDVLGNIADICIDWDGYRTADGLGGLINEIWAYARYCADNLAKAQEAVEPTIDIRHSKSMWRCGSCATALQPNQIHTKFCFNCGRAVKWE